MRQFAAGDIVISAFDDEMGTVERVDDCGAYVRWDDGMSSLEGWSSIDTNLTRPFGRESENDCRD